VVVTIDLGLCDEKDVIEEEVAKVTEVVPLPIFYACLECLNGLNVFGAPLGLIDFVRHTFRRRGASSKIVVQGIVRARRLLQ